MNHPVRKPIIGLNMECKPAYNQVPGVSYLFSGYVDSIVRAGGIPILLPPADEPEFLSEALSHVDGCVLVGGSDLDPRNDGFMLHPFVRPMSPRRERFDRTLMEEIAKRRLPVMGIGVGMQLLNVSQGGSLFLHIPEDIPNAMPHRDNMDPSLRHALTIEKGTLLDAVYGENDVRVNSMHHMAIDDVAAGFVVSARCPGDNVVEAIESVRDDWFAIGVQFHPEAPSATFLDQRIFGEFVKGVVAFHEECKNIYAWNPLKAEPRHRGRRSKKSVGK